MRATRDGRLDRIEVVGVVAGKANSPSLERAKSLAIPYFSYADQDDYDHLERFSEVLSAIFKYLQPNIVGQYGWDHQTPESILRELDKVLWINQHPGPVDPSEHDFGGQYMSCAPRIHATRLMFTRFTGRNDWTDVTSQKVSPKLDGGGVFKRERVWILPTHTVQSLQQDALRTEWETQILTLYDYERFGSLVTLPPYHDLVRPEERRTLRIAKQISRKLYHANGDPIPSFDSQLVLDELRDDQVTMDEINLMLSHLIPKIEVLA